MQNINNNEQELSAFAYGFNEIHANTDGIAYVLDFDDRIYSVSSKFLQEFCIDDERLILNQTLGQQSILRLVWYRNNYFQIANWHQQIRQLSQAKIYLEILCYEGEWSIYIVHKNPILNSGGMVIGIHVQMRHFMPPRLAQIFVSILKIKVIPTKLPSIQTIKLTEKQHMVLFLYARNYSATEVASLLTLFGYKITAWSVNEHLENLKHIIDVQTNEQLRDRAYQLGFDTTIPAAFVKEGVYDISHEVLHHWIE